MVSLTTQKEAREVRNLPFCYLCGNAFEDGVSINHDHVPPESIFDRADRNFPLKLVIHEEQCHRPMNLDDEVLGQLVALIHGKQPSEKNDKLKIDIYQRLDSGSIMAAFIQRNLELLLRRWLSGFHAALYREPLDSNTRFAIQTPFPSGTIKDCKFVEDPIRDQHYKFVECIKRNRAANNLDHIVAIVFKKKNLAKCSYAWSASSLNFTNSASTSSAALLNCKRASATLFFRSSNVGK